MLKSVVMTADADAELTRRSSGGETYYMPYCVAAQSRHAALEGALEGLGKNTKMTALAAPDPVGHVLSQQTICRAIRSSRRGH